MRNFLKLTVFSAFLAAGFVIFSINPTSAGSVSTAENAFDAASSPRSLYVQNCASCHGSNGKAQTKKGRRVEADDLTEGHVKGMSTARIEKVIRNGKGKMPAFRKLKPADVAAIANYIKSL
jgi:mono/diheme cytochrome c family protein